MTTDETWKSIAQTDLGILLGKWRPLSGGDFAQSYTATVIAREAGAANNPALAAGTQVFIKTHATPPPNHFSTEAQGLQWLAQTNTVRVPEVLGVSDEAPYLAIAWVEEAPGAQTTPDGEAEFGRQLAAMHRFVCNSFGREDERSTGSLGLQNAPFDNWPDFYATQRLLPLARIAAERHALSAKTISAIESLAAHLDQWVSPTVNPSRLHGDLWAGNRLVDTNGHSWIIDPASHGGHREFDLAMMRLFGGYGDTCFSAYNEMFPLDENWQERIAVHQLAPLIVHAIKFGHAYVGPIEDALAGYGF